MNRAILLTLTLLLAASAAWAQPKIEATLSAEVEVKMIVDGRESVVRVPAEEAASGQTVFYTLTYRNAGDRPATGVKLTDPIPAGTAYVVGSAWGEGSEVSFSIDGGKTYKKPALLTYKVTRPDGTAETRVATPEEYTHIQWVLGTIPAGVSGTAGFQARVK